MLRPRVGLCLPASIERVESATEIHINMLGTLAVLYTPMVKELEDEEGRAEALRAAQQMLAACDDPHVLIELPTEIVVLLDHVDEIPRLYGNIFLSRDKTLRDELIHAELIADAK